MGQPRRKDSVAGHDGFPPIYVEVRQVSASGKAHKLASPQNINATRITHLYHTRAIDERQFEAATRLVRDWEKSEILPHASNVLVGAGGGSSSNNLPNDQKVDAMKRHGAAVDYLLERRVWPIVDMVVQRDMSVGKAAGLLRIHHQRASERLSLALHFLADHYGLPGHTRCA